MRNADQRLANPTSHANTWSGFEEDPHPVVVHTPNYPGQVQRFQNPADQSRGQRRCFVWFLVTCGGEVDVHTRARLGMPMVKLPVRFGTRFGQGAMPCRGIGEKREPA
jgi:hypothetical protein